LRVFAQAVGFSPPIMITDADPAMNVVIAQTYLLTRHLHCIWHIGQNLLKNLRNKLQSEYEGFAKAFFQCRNRLEIDIFEHKYSELIEKYPAAQTYLERLLKSKKA